MKAFPSYASSLVITVLLFIGCGPTGRFLQSSDYQKSDEIKKIWLTVVGSEHTTQCFNYLQRYLTDTLSRHGFAVDGSYYCCRDKSTDMSSVFKELVPDTLSDDHILTVVITKDVIGYGATSSRELVVTLYSVNDRKMEWNGKVTVSFDWFISDDNYRNVATKISAIIMKELMSKGIVST